MRDELNSDTDKKWAFLQQEGEMARLIRELDWTQSPLGPIEHWSPALRSAVGICLGSRFPIVLYWGPTRALIYNDAWAPVPGQKHPWALGRAGWEVWSEIWDIIGPMFDQVMESGVATWSEDQLLPLNRFGYVEECYFYYSYSPVRGESGTVEGIFTAVTETTYRVLAERRERLLRSISETTSKTRSAVDACQAVVDQLASMPEEAPFSIAYLVEADGQTLKRVALSGMGEDVELAPPTISLASNHTPWPFANAVARDGRAIEGMAERFAGRLPSAPWPEPVEEALVLPIPSARPEAPHGYLVLGISPRRRMNQEYRTLFERAAAHVSTAIANIEAYDLERRRAEQLAELDRAKTAFFSNASHEFRTPLTLMLGPLDEMLAGLVNSEQLVVSREDLQMVHRNGQRLLRLVNTLLDFSRLEAGRAKARFEPTDLGTFTADVASNFRSAMERAGLEFDIDCPAMAQPVWLDHEMWEKVVLNLVSNAFKYTLQGRVLVRVRMLADAAVLEVSDSGVGIPEGELPRVFERFHRIEGQAGRTHEGTGIGLALVKDLVALHGGEVSARSGGTGKGSVFQVRIPLGKAHVPDEDMPTQPVVSTALRADTFVAEALRWLPHTDDDVQPPASLPSAGRQGARIVLADDNADMRGYVARLLREAGFIVDAVGDGAAALKLVQKDRPDLVLSDVMMPLLDGFGLLAALRRNPALSDLPVILLSARAGEEESVEGLDAGADDYLVKPFSARELLARVDGALRMARLRSETGERLRRLNEDLELRVAARTRERDSSWLLSEDLIGVADDQGIWQSINPAWTRKLGWSEDKIIGRTSEWMEHPDDVQRTRAEVRRLAQGHTTYQFDNRYRTTEGSYRLLSWRAVPRDGQLYCIARDVTEERARADELYAARDALRQTQKMEAIGQLTGGIAHDFNNMLAAVLGALELLKRKLARSEDEHSKRYVNTAIHAAKRAAGLTARMLAFGRRQSLDMQPIEVNPLISGMEELLHRTLDENIVLNIESRSGAWAVCSDANQLENALLNLSINARDAMPEGGRLTIATRNVPTSEALSFGAPQARDYLCITVSDTGTGMAPEILEKVFDPFFTTKPIGKGTGLGLSMVYGFMQQSHGHVTVESRLGEGTSVHLLLPRLEHMPAKAELSVPAVPGGTGQKVLIVEDEADVRQLVAEVLEQLGYKPLQASDGSAALEVLERERNISLLVSDVGLPGINGRVLAQKARELHADLRVLFITGYAAEAAARAEFLGSGMQMLGKPFAVDDLAKAVHSMIG